MFFMFISFEKLDLTEMRIWFNGITANLFVSKPIKANTRKTERFNFSKGFYLFFFLKTFNSQL